MFKTFADWFQTSSKYAEDKNDFSHELAELVTALMVEAAAADGHIGAAETQLISDCVSSQFNLADDETKQFWIILKKEKKLNKQILMLFQNLNILVK